MENAEFDNIMSLKCKTINIEEWCQNKNMGYR